MLPHITFLSTSSLSGIRVTLPKFGGDESDYESWRFALRAYLGRHGLVQALDSGTLSAEQKYELYYLIASSVEGGAVATVIQAQEGDGAAAWKALEDRYDSKRVTAKFSPLRKLMSEKCTNVADAEEWINGKLRAVRKLSAMGITVNEVALLGIVDNLPGDMAGIADIVLANESTELAVVKRLVLEKQDALQRMEVDTAANLNTQAGKKVTCMWCGQDGHWAVRCPHGRTRQTNLNMTCYGCNKVGHIKRNCPQNPQGSKAKQVQATVAQLLHAAAESEE